ncbi:hypothetical protein LBMAG50_09260 [Phycisphaerae bacterium]|nr:hypothetical protein LBMAG50_09260 [Phycisphaerae bacterium]
MRAPPIQLSVTMAALGAAQNCFTLAVKLNVAGVQFDASQPGLRPRELDIGARRDVAATLRRQELVASGIDCFIPIERFEQLDAVERAMTALFESIAFAEFLGRVPVSVFMPTDAALVTTICQEATRRGVLLADFTRPVGCSACGIGIDPSTIVMERKNPAQEISAAGTRLVAARVNDIDQVGQRGPIGTGRVDAMSYRVALEVCGFQHLPVIDCRSWRQPVEESAQCVKRWNELIPAVNL